MLCFDPITCYLNRGNKEVVIIDNMNYMKVLEWSTDDFIILSEVEKIFICSQIVLIEKSLTKIEWDLKGVSNLIQTINDYYVENKHDLTW
jgi:hypothetical protein